MPVRSRYQTGVSDDPRAVARALAREAIAAGTPTAWFEALYREAGAGRARVPWDDRAPNPAVVRWLDAQDLRPGDAALDVGCGTGDNAAELARRGLVVTAFDVSPTAVAAAQARYGAVAGWQVADVLALRLQAVDVARAVLRTCQQLHGAAGVCDEYDVSVLARLVQPALRLPWSAERTAHELMATIQTDGFEGLFPHGGAVA